MTYGVDENGFTLKPFTTILDEIEEDQRDDIDAEIDQGADGPVGQVNNIIALKLSEAWEIFQSIYNILDPDTASGVALDNICKITGVTRLVATASTSNITVTGTNATVVLASSIISNATNSINFANAAAGTLATATSWAGTTAYTADTIVTNNARIYVCITAGTSGSTGPTTQASSITDGTAVWRWVGDGAAYATIAFTCSTTGVNSANAYTLNTIQTPISGWSGCLNLADAVEGTALETDSALRTRRDSLLAVAGSATLEAIKADLSAMTNMLSVSMLENDTDTTDTTYNLTPHSFEAIVWDNNLIDDDDIAQTIWESKPAGIYAFGSDSGTATDTADNEHTVYFKRATEVDIYVSVILTVDSATYAGDAAVKTKIAAYEDELSVGDDVYIWKVGSGLDDIAGVNNVTSVLISETTPGTGSSDITIAYNEIASFDTANITVTTS